MTTDSLPFLDFKLDLLANLDMIFPCCEDFLPIVVVSVLAEEDEEEEEGVWRFESGETDSRDESDNDVDWELAACSFFFRKAFSIMLGLDVSSSQMT
jgi:hypothetical protein